MTFGKASRKNSQSKEKINMSNLDDLLLQYKAETGENTEKVKNWVDEMSKLEAVGGFIDWLVLENTAMKKHIAYLEKLVDRLQ